MHEMYPVPVIADRGVTVCPVRVLFVSSECYPLVKTGGLADVVAALPRALGRLGHDVTVITPRYRGVTDGPVAGQVTVEVAGRHLHGALMEAPDDGRGAIKRRPRVLLLDCPEIGRAHV